MRNIREQAGELPDKGWTQRPDGKWIQVTVARRIDHCEYRGLVYKYCRQGDHWLETTYFNREKRSWDGLNPACASCRSSFKRNIYATNPKEREAARFRSIHTRYGITRERWQQMWDLFNGRCHLCLEEFNAEYRKPHVDHCHRTGRIRGLLCYLCNTELGFVERVRNAKQRVDEYLEDDFNWASEVTPYIEQRLLPPQGDEYHYGLGITGYACDDVGA